MTEKNNFEESYNELKQEFQDLNEMNKSCAQVFAQLVHYQSKQVKKNRETIKNTLNTDTKNACYSIFQSYNDLILEKTFLSQCEESIKKFENQKNMALKIDLINSNGNHIDKLIKNKATSEEIQKKYLKYSEDVNHIFQLNINNFYQLFKQFMTLYISLYEHSRKLNNEYKQKAVDSVVDALPFQSSMLNKSNKILDKEKDYRQKVIDEFFKNYTSNRSS